MRTSLFAAALAVAAGALVPSTPATAAPVPPHVTRLEVPANFTAHASAINDLGQIVGSVGIRPAVWDMVTGKVRYLPVPPEYARGWATAINTSGVIVGAVLTPAGKTRAVRWNLNGTLTFLTSLDAENSTAEAISDNGKIAGLYAGRLIARFDGGNVVTIGGANATGAVTAISSDGGAIVGYFQDPTCPDCPRHGFEQGVNGIMLLPPAPDGISEPAGVEASNLRIAGTVNYQAVTWRIQLSPANHKPFWKRTTLGYVRPGAPTYARAMTGDGTTIVGDAEVDGSTRVWIHRDGAFTELPDADSTATSVNRSGDILGTIGGQPVVWH